MPIDVEQYELVRKPLGELKPFKRNARKHPEKQIKLLVKNMEEVGFTNPLLIEPNGGIIAGHGRLMAAKRVGLTSVPCIVLAGLTDHEKRALVLADNQVATVATWDHEMLKDELAALGDIPSFDIELTGFDFGELTAVDPKLMPTDAETVENRAAQSDQESFEEQGGLEQPSGIDVASRRDDVQFASTNPLGIPDLDPHKLGTLLPSVPWNRKKPEEVEPANCVFTWGEHRRAICKPEHTRGATLCFFEEDDAFAGIWDSPSKAVAKMEEYEWGQVILPDFTFYRDSPLIIQQWVHFKTLYMGRYFQEAGFSVVPKLHLVDPKDSRVTGWQYYGLPKGSPIVAVQVNTVYGRTTSQDSHEQRGTFFRMMEQAIEHIEPQGVIIYGGKDHEDHMREHLPQGPEYRIIAGISSLHRAKNTKSGNW